MFPVLGIFLYQMYGDIVEITDFSTFCHKYQVQILKIDKKNTPGRFMNIPLNFFNHFQNFTGANRGSPGPVSGADFAKNQHFELL